MSPEATSFIRTTTSVPSPSLVPVTPVSISKTEHRFRKDRSWRGDTVSPKINHVSSLFFPSSCYSGGPWGHHSNDQHSRRNFFQGDIHGATTGPDIFQSTSLMKTTMRGDSSSRPNPTSCSDQGSS
ncbi:hypothetical protein AAY473_018956 [Plecturocebus cupreus]